MTQAEAIDLIDGHLQQGQFFLAYDAYRHASAQGVQGLRLTLLGALSLLRCGAVNEARRLLAPLGTRLESQWLRRQRMAQAFTQAVRHALAVADGVANASVPELDACLQMVQGCSSAGAEADDPETLRLMAQVLLEIAATTQDPEDLAQAERLAEQTFSLSGSAADALAAARLAAMCAQPALAAQRAMQALDRLGLAPAGTAGNAVQGAWQHHAMRIELALLRQDAALLRAALDAAAVLGARHLPTVVDLLRRLDLLERAGVDISAEVRACIVPPKVVAFTGQAIDAVDGIAPCFPPVLEAAVAQRIAAELDAMDAEVGFSSAGAGAELLFVEAMLDRGAQVHVFLPFCLDDFIAHRVAYAGGHWERRLRNACKLATSVTYATEEAYLGHDELLRFNQHLIHGAVRSYADANLCEPSLLGVWDYAAAGGAGSVADFIDSWVDPSSLRLIDLDVLRDEVAPAALVAPVEFAPSALVLAPVPPSSLSPAAARPAAVRVIRTMLFADLVGYSKLQEQDLPLLWQLLETLKPRLAGPGAALRLIESWGDAVYAVMDNSLDLAAYAFALIDALAGLDAQAAGLSRTLQVRVGLHAGPVYEGLHPLTGRAIVYGSHVSRAARIEPVSLPGHVYASQQFVAKLMAEESACAHLARATGLAYQRQYTVEYLGQLSLAKNYGRQSVFHVRRAG